MTSRKKDLKEIPLETRNYDAMVNLLEQIYPGRGFELMKDNTIEDLLELADKYQVEQVFTNCKAYIEMMMEYQPPINKTLLYLKIVEQYGHCKQLHSLRERLVKSASLIPSNRIKRSRHYSSLPPTAQRDVFFRRLQELEKIT
ncbi:uncharacterized protein LOC112574125 [Pomacea canaliculata]|uniref:uncharacterized protein LOC112574125 n=1 Tax=Pomacea canaliculata TaxID=400727 RepID=UPI000D738ACD|nr:uncharacterized protein LOC112574125 [Pomacea canaliculata]